MPSVSGFVSSGGRVFHIVDQAPGGMIGSVPDKWSLVAGDAFNGAAFVAQADVRAGLGHLADVFVVDGLE